MGLEFWAYLCGVIFIIATIILVFLLYIEHPIDHQNIKFVLKVILIYAVVAVTLIGLNVFHYKSLYNQSRQIETYLFNTEGIRMDEIENGFKVISQDQTITGKDAGDLSYLLGHIEGRERELFQGRSYAVFLNEWHGGKLITLSDKLTYSLRKHSGSGKFDYSAENLPDIIVYIKRSSEWETYTTGGGTFRKDVGFDYVDIGFWDTRRQELAERLQVTRSVPGSTDDTTYHNVPQRTIDFFIRRVFK